MQAAIGEAHKALALNEVPVGCVIWHEPTDRIVGRGFNRREIDADPTAHAEILALRNAARELGDWRLIDCVAAVTLEPCPMCAGALVHARVRRLVYGCDDPKAGAVRSLFSLCDTPKLNHRLEITGGVLAETCSRLLADFFSAQRALGKK